MSATTRRRLAADVIPGPGHNQPPGPMSPEQVTAGLRDSCSDIAARQAEILGGITRFLARYPTIPGDDIQSRATDFAGREGAIAKWLKQAEEKRIAEKEPHLAAERAVDGYFKSLTTAVIDGRKTIVSRMTAYAEAKEAAERKRLQAEAAAAAERARIAEEQALKSMQAEALDTAATAAEEAEHAQARTQATAAELSRVQGSVGVSSLRTVWQFDEANSDLMALARAVVEGRAPLAYLAFATTRINYAVRSERIRQIAGCVIKPVRSV